VIEGMIGAFIGGMAALFFHDRRYWIIWWKYGRFGKSVAQLEFPENQMGFTDYWLGWVEFKARHPDIIVLINGVEIK